MAAVDTVIVNWNSTITALWTLANADTGNAAIMNRFADRTVAVTGTFGGATVTVEGSNDKVNWFTLNDNAGAALTFTAAGMKLILENPVYVRAKTAGGAGTAVSVIIAGAGGQ